jgi:iron complex transport system substrate-binding protein
VNRRFRTWGAAVAALALVTAACGGDDSDDASPADTALTDTVPADTGEQSGDSTDDASSPATPGNDEATTAESPFPVTIEHKYGETTIEAAPERVVSIGFAEHDLLLALGVIPVAVRDWYGDQPYGTWPWAQDELGDAQPELLSAGELNFEQIAELDPDLIVGIASGMTDTDYATLAAIAPTVAQPDEYVDYGTPWGVTIEMLGQATGYAGVAAEVIDRTNQMFAEVRAEHPEFTGATAAVAFYFEELPGAYASQDIRARALADLGFVTPPEFDDLAGDQFYFSVSPEQIATLDQDVVIWIVGDPTVIDTLRDMPLRPTMTAFTEGREVMADFLLSGAFSHAGPLSFEYVIETLVPELALAVDGDPATPVPSAALIAPTDDAPATGEEDAASAAWATVFDSTIAFSAKADHMEDAASLEPTVEAYAAAGESMGGISLVPTSTRIDGDIATITYDVLFGDQAAYSDLTGLIDNVDGTWVVPRTEFCSFMASARTPCP